MHGLLDKIEAAAESLQEVRGGSIRVGLILGTGLGGLADQIEVEATVPYDSIPHFPESTSPSHRGTLLLGTLRGVPVAAMQGRMHYYEGHSLRDVTFPVRVMKQLGAETLILTSAVGGLNPQFSLGDLVIIEDHIDLIPDNPLRGINDDRLGPRFPDMSEPYCRRLIEIAKQIALEQRTSTQTGVLAAVAGPNLETRAEYRMLKLIGADVVGMSTVPEAIVAAHAGLQTVAFSIVTDMCLPDALEPARVEDIIRVAEEGGRRLEPVIAELVGQLRG